MRLKGMRKNLEHFNDIYKDNLNQIPLDELGEIVYSKHYQYLENLNINPTAMDFKPIQDILEGSEFYKRAFLFSQLYMSTLMFLFKEHEEMVKYIKKNSLSSLELLMYNVEEYKNLYNMVEIAKKGKTLERLEGIQLLLEEIIENYGKIIKEKTHEDKLKTLLDVLNGEKEGFELYRTRQELEYLKSASEDLYNIYLKEVYPAENAKTPSKDDGYLKVLLEDVLSGVFLRKEDDYYKSSLEGE
jgi:hypothetical protein